MFVVEIIRGYHILADGRVLLIHIFVGDACGFITCDVDPFNMALTLFLECIRGFTKKSAIYLCESTRNYNSGRRHCVIVVEYAHKRGQTSFVKTLLKTPKFQHLIAARSA